MQNILLCMPKIKYKKEDIFAFFPLGISYISSYLKSKGFNVHCLNLTMFDDPHKVLEAAIKEKKITMVGTGGVVTLWQAIKDIVDTTKRINPDIVTFIGGGLVTFTPTEAMQIIDNADYGIIGEGEITSQELINAVQDGNDVSKINGLIYRNKDNTFNITNVRKDIKYLDTLPFPDYEGFNFQSNLGAVGSLASILSSRGCPFSCTFCCHSGGRKYRCRSLDSIFSEIDFLVLKYNIKNLSLNDELFAVNADRIVDFCNRIKPYNIKWSVDMRLSKFITAELLSLMKESGCVKIFYGLESASDNILKSMHKKTTVTEMERVLTLTKNAGILVFGDFLFGDTEETIETVGNTYKWIEEHHQLLDYSSFVMIILYPGSKLYSKAVQNGKIKNTVEFIKNGCPLVNVSKLSDKEYWQLANFDLEKFRYLIHKRPLSVDFTEKKKKDTYNIEWLCDKCNNKNNEVLCISDLPNSMEFECKHCGQRFVFNFFYDYILWVDDILKNLLKNNQVVFWGINTYFPRIYNYGTALKEFTDKYKMIDRKYKELGDFEGMQINAPPIKKLAKDEVPFDLAVVPVISDENFNSIASEIEKYYPGVKALSYLRLGLLPPPPPTHVKCRILIVVSRAENKPYKDCIKSKVGRYAA